MEKGLRKEAKERYEEVAVEGEEMEKGLREYSR